MSATGWTRKWKDARAAPVVAEDRAGGLIRAAVRGDALDQLLDQGVRSLLAAAGADRAGLWLTADRFIESARGRVVEATPGPIPELWKQFDISTPLLRAVLESTEPLSVECANGETVANLGPLVGMHSAIWIPLRVKNRSFGVAMVAHERPAAHPDMEVLQACADELVLAVRHDRESRRSELASEETRAQLRISRAILCGVSADSILPQIARAARHYQGAEFVAVGRGNDPPVLEEGWDGPDTWFSALYQKPLLHLWRRAMEEGQECEIPARTVRIRKDSESSLSADSVSGSSSVALDRVVAIPIEVRGTTRGVFMAGLSVSESTAEHSSEDMAGLESYALLAASALDREFARDERTARRRSLRTIIQDSRESLVVIDEKGIVREASPTGAALLFPTWGRLDESALEDFFTLSARRAVARWRHRIASPAGTQDSDFAPELDRTQRSLDAELDRGTAVRLNLRSEIEGFGPDRSLWLIHLDDHRAKQAAREAEGRLESEIAALADSIESGVLLLDAAGNIRLVSNRLAAILGFETRRLMETGNVEALIDTVASHFSSPVETAAHWREHVRRGDEVSWDEFELSQPSRRILERFARPIFGQDGARQGWLEVYRDITGQRLIQSKLLQSEKMAALGQLVSGIAHELNNPLTSIQGYAHLLLSRREGLDRSGDALRISQEAERAGRIVKNLLLFAREAEPERRPVNVNEIIERTLALRAYELKLQNIVVELAFDPHLPKSLGDSAQLQQVVLNLIVNAEQAIVLGRREESRSGKILIRSRRLAGDRIAIDVSDDGPGISPEVVSRIFDPFFTTKPAGIGTGLGLSIVYGIIQAHGGEVSVGSPCGEGATLTVELPALAGSAFEFPNRTPAIAPHSTGVVPLTSSIPPAVWTAARSERMLVVEDEPTVAELIADVLTGEGHRVDTLLDSRKALDKLAEKNYALVICDLKMPNLDGPALYRALVSTGSPSQHRLLFVTGDTMSPRTLEFLKSSGLPYLAKPFLVDELKEAVNRALDGVPASGEITAVPERPRAFTRGK